MLPLAAFTHPALTAVMWVDYQRAALMMDCRVGRGCHISGHQKWKQTQRPQSDQPERETVSSWLSSVKYINKNNFMFLLRGNACLFPTGHASQTSGVETSAARITPAACDHNSNTSFCYSCKIQESKWIISLRHTSSTGDPEHTVSWCVIL